MNQRRKLSSVDKVTRQKKGKVVDMVFKYDGYDIGAYETKRSSREYNDEVITDERIKVPKIMKGILIKLLTIAPTKLRQLETVGIITSGSKSGRAKETHKRVCQRRPCVFGDMQSKVSTYTFT
ncbi:hypothetical protein RMATCC62417_01303 [Rhizopus microsporus]|nr:hypothetical protein RMATCC62417_01303 [Rhizopus microsporus]